MVIRMNSAQNNFLTYSYLTLGDSKHDWEKTMNDPLIKIGKSLGDVAWFQSDFLESEDHYRARQLETEAIYARGPARTRCILCNSVLEKAVSYCRGDLEYIKCATCTHVNGNYDFTDEFLSHSYEESDSGCGAAKPYAKEFVEGKMVTDFDAVVKRIYQPKSEFLLDSLIHDGYDVSDLSVTDVGCGAGHFLSALQEIEVPSICGFDTLESAVRTAKLNLNQATRVDLATPQYVWDFLENGSADVVSMMCVLPHLRNPTKALRLMARNPDIHYTFQKLPMWSFSTLLEAAFPNLRSRVLGMDHTHVFTEKSLEWIEHSLGLRRVSSWSFGSDALDLQRKLVAQISKLGASPEFTNLAAEQMIPLLEGLQKTIDQSGQSSEIHVLWAFD